MSQRSVRSLMQAPVDRRGKRLAFTLIVAGVLVASALLAANPIRQNTARAANGQVVPPGLTVVTVVRRDLVSRVVVDGTLGYAQLGRKLTNQLSGVVTAMPAPGTVISRGQPLYWVNDLPVILMYGDLPAWRALDTGISGSDVLQLELNLRALGFANGRTLNPDGHFTDADAQAVRRWQKAIGLPATGAAELGRVVFLPGQVRVASNDLEIGAATAPGSFPLTVTSPTRAVAANVSTALETLVRIGAIVEVTLPGGQVIAGDVSGIARNAQSQQSNIAGQQNPSPTATMAVQIRLSDGQLSGDFDQEPVKVAFVADSAKNVLAVPINALLALPNGGYAVEVVSERNARHLVQVTTGLFDEADNLVEVRGAGLEEGLHILVPSET
jgi:peptidoglycan hydrolase-like protein with peptidoglycan-binding domain